VASSSICAGLLTPGQRRARGSSRHRQRHRRRAEVTARQGSARHRFATGRWQYAGLAAIGGAYAPVSRHDRGAERSCVAGAARRHPIGAPALEPRDPRSRPRGGGCEPPAAARPQGPQCSRSAERDGPARAGGWFRMRAAAARARASTAPAIS
jgi:hypothetical protein